MTPAANPKQKRVRERRRPRLALLNGVLDFTADPKATTIDWSLPVPFPWYTRVAPT